MADIFLSYTEQDRDAVRRLAETLQSVGWSVWWDRRIPAGLTWRIVLERELQHMRCMVVLWSQHSVQSDWVCEEAAEGRQLGRLVPVLIERVRPPAGFREIQAADLVDWDGSRGSGSLQRLLEDIERLIGKPGLVPDRASSVRPERSRGFASPAAKPSTRKRLAWGAGAAVVAFVAFVAAAGYFGAPRRDPDTDTARDTTRSAPAAAAAQPESVPGQRYGPYATQRRADEVSAEFERTGCRASVSAESQGYYVAVQC